MYKKEAGSVCEFLSNRLENSKSGVRHIQSNSITSLDATASLSSSVNSITTTTPVTTPSIKSKNHFRITHNQAILSQGKQTDLKKTNPPLKAEIYESLNKASDSIVLKETPSNQTKNDVDQEQEPPKPPARRMKKQNLQNLPLDSPPVNQIQDEKSFQDPPLSRNDLRLANLNVNIPKYESPKMPENQMRVNPVVYRNRSNSSTNYENSSSGEYIEKLSQFHQKYINKKNDGSAVVGSSKQSSEHNVRNGLYIDLSAMKEMRSKKNKPQLVSLIGNYTGTYIFNVTNI